MRTALILLLTGCLSYAPEPQPPRVVCQGTAVPAGYAVVGNSTCYQLPADRCYADGSEECQEEARAREQHNAEVRSQRRTTAVVLLLVAAGVLTAALVAQ